MSSIRVPRASGDKPGTATITVAGDISGVSASRIVKVTDAPVETEFLVVKNNLSEIAAAGTDAQAASRKNLGLGALATKDAITAVDVGGFPVADKTLPAGTDLHTITEPGEYFQNVTSNAKTALNYPEEVAGALRVYKTVMWGRVARSICRTTRRWNIGVMRLAIRWCSLHGRRVDNKKAGIYRPSLI